MPVEIKNSKGEVILVYPGESLVNADLRNRILKDAVLSGQDCSGALFDNSDLEFAHCRGTKFRRSSFRDAYMLHFQGQESDCEEADWEGANIERAEFLRANLFRARNWHKRSRDFQAKFLGATMPDGRKVEEA